MPDVTRFGIIGTGMMGCEHIRSLAQIPHARVSAVADPVETSLDAARVALGDRAEGVRCYSDPRELLRDANVDALVVASPNHTHAAVLDEVFRTDLPVLVEKPLLS